MVTNNYDFKTITRLRMLCMKVLPTVYGDALSYEEQVCKVTEKINQLVDTVNELPDYIIEVVKELIKNAGLENIVKQVLAEMYFINVKNPPAPYVAAKGDGTTNDTDAIQALINYAALQRSYLFFPAGNYLVNGLTMVENVSLVGLDRYTTIITLAPNSNHDLITGFVKNATMSNLTLNANMNGQTANCSCLNTTVENALIDFMIFKNGYDSVVIENTNEFEGAYLMFDGIQHNALTLNGDGAVISNVIFKNASQLSSNALAVINGNNKITGIFSNVSIPNGVVISASGATVEGTILNAVTTITGGNGNYVKIKDLTGINKYGTNDTETFTGNKTTSAVAATEIYSGNKTTTAANDTENITTTKEINATDITLNPTNPLGYKAPVVLNRKFKSVPFKNNNVEYNVLVENDVEPDFKNVLDYGAKGDGVTNDSEAFTKAITAVANGGVILVPAGKYLIDGINISDKRIIFRGENGNTNPGSVILSTGNNKTFTITGGGVSFYNIAFNAPENTAKGFFIKQTNVLRINIIDCFFLNAYKSIIVTSGSEINIDRCQFLVGTPSRVSPGSCFIDIGSEAYTAPVTINNCLLRNNVGDDTEYGIVLRYTDGVNISNTTINCCGINILLYPSTGQSNTYTNISNCILDTAKYDGITLQPEGDGRVFRISINNTWCGNNGRTNVAINGTISTGIIDSVEITGCMLQEGSVGVSIIGNTINSITLNNSFIYGVTNNAIQVTEGAKNVTIHDNYIGNYGFPGQANHTNIVTDNDSIVEIYRNNFTKAKNASIFGINTNVGYNVGTEWTTYTPTVAGTSGDLGAYTAYGNYCVNGNTIEFDIRITITNIGTASGGISITLPKAAKTGFACSARTGPNCGTAFAGTGGGTIVLYKYDGSFPVANNDIVYLSGSYQF